MTSSIKYLIDHADDVGELKTLLSTESALELMCRAHDAEASAQRGEPDPWRDDLVADYQRESGEAAWAEWRSERLTAMRCAIRAAVITPVERGLAFIDSLSNTERSAFLGLFAGAKFSWIIYDDGLCPFIGKAECEWVEDWRDFYSRRLPEAGLFHWSEGESGPALGMIPKPDGSRYTWTKIACGPTPLGFEVRDAWWARRARSTPAP